MTESVAFDEHGYGEGDFGHVIIIPIPVYPPDVIFPATSLVRAGDEVAFPQDLFDESTEGWLYLNLDDPDREGAHQNWVTVVMHAGRRSSAAFDAAWLGNGCSPAAWTSYFTESENDEMPGPAEDVNP